jgi:hypothetical protein
MNAVKIFSVDFPEKRYAFSHDKLLNGTIFAERETHRHIKCHVLVCAYTNSRSIVFHNVVAFLFPDRVIV